jgi:hypothetical protein
MALIVSPVNPSVARLETAPESAGFDMSDMMLVP